MKAPKILLVALLAVLFALMVMGAQGCTKAKATPEQFPYTTVRKVGNCEYIVFFTSTSVIGAVHKGDCANPFHDIKGR